jgi:hypothetical protein
MGFFKLRQQIPKNQTSTDKSKADCQRGLGRKTIFAVPHEGDL